MKPRVTDQVWIERARNLELEWVFNTPKRNDEKTTIRCLRCGHTWDVFPANVAKGRRSCEPCAGASSRVSDHDWIARLKTGNATWTDGTPKNNSDKSRTARCNLCSQFWKVDPRKAEQGHPRCPGRVSVPAIEADEWVARAAAVGVEWIEIPTKSKEPTMARCLKCRFEWSPRPDNIRSGSGCPQCSKHRVAKNAGKKVTPEEWGRRAALAEVKWVNGTPETSTSKTPVECLKCSYRWSPWPNNLKKGSGCPACARNIPVSQETWDERALKVQVKWLEPVRSRHGKYRAVCLTCDYEWRTEAGAVANGSGCPECGSEFRRKGRLLDSQIWIDRAKSAGLKWIELPDNNSNKRRISCTTCNYEWMVIPGTVASGAGCPVCSGVIVQPETWHQRASAAGLEWLELPSSARKPTKARCLRCGLIWSPNPDGVSKGSGCPDCAETGYKLGQPGLFYFVERTSDYGRPARKIGITNTSSSSIRLALWKRQGFEVKAKLTHENGELILQLEQILLKWLRNDLGLPPHLDKEEMPKGGETETFSPDEPSEKDFLEKMNKEFQRLVSEGERNHRQSGSI